MSSLGIYACAAANPNFLSLAYFYVWMGVHERYLYRQLSRHPQIVRIQESQIAPSGPLDSTIPRCRHAAVRLRDDLK